jgi:TRAP-type C4-dicarboxylate transport system substrate-binding protein
MRAARGVLVGLAALACVACWACVRPAHEHGVWTLRYASLYPPQNPFSRADQTWIEHVERASGGRLRIEAFWSGSLLSSDQSLIELRHGVADVGAITPIYARGGAHAQRTQAGFYAGAANFGTQVATYKCLAQRFPVLNAELAGLRVLAVQGGNLPGVITRNTPIRTLHDLTGLRLRAPSELTEVLHALHVDPVNMPMGDVYSSMAKGVIDGVIAPPDALRALHLAEVGRYYGQLSIPRGAYPSRAISVQALARLPSDLQAILLASGPVWELALAHEVGAALATGRRYALERGMQFTTLPEADQRAFAEAYNAASLVNARQLAPRGIDGESMFKFAQAFIRSMSDPTLPLTAAVCPAS